MSLLQNIPAFFPLLDHWRFEPRSYQSPGSESDTTGGCVFTTEELALSPVKVGEVRKEMGISNHCRDRDKSG